MPMPRVWNGNRHSSPSVLDPCGQAFPCSPGRAPCASPHPTDPPGAGFPAWCGKSNPLLYCPDAQTLVMKCGTARRIPSGSTNCIVCKPHPFSCFLTVLFSALYVPFCQPGTAGCPTPASHVSVEVTHDPV